jgi:flagellar motor switch/type III secretory pathway protein FliN
MPCCRPLAYSLLRAQVPVAVTLAAKKEAVSRIVALAPGSILRFDKSCHEPLDLEIGNRRIAKGICVQSGQRLSLQITRIVGRDERFAGRNQDTT